MKLNIELFHISCCLPFEGTLSRGKHGTWNPWNPPHFSCRNSWRCAACL